MQGVPSIVPEGWRGIRIIAIMPWWNGGESELNWQVAGFVEMDFI